MTRDDWLALPAYRIETLTHPVTGATVYVRSMTSDERDEWEAGQYQLNGANIVANRKQVRARLILRCLCDADGKRVFGDNDLSMIGGLDARLTDPLYEAAYKINRLSKADVEELEKNSGGGPTAVSS